MEFPISLRAGNNASMVNATIDIKDAINATNSFLKIIVYTMCNVENNLVFECNRTLR